MNETKSDTPRTRAKLLSERLQQLSDAVTRGREGMSEFTMRVPAEPDRDADLGLQEASKLLLELERKLAQAQERYRILKEDHESEGDAHEYEETKLQEQLALAQADSKRLDWLENRSFMLYRGFDAETNEQDDHVVCVDETTRPYRNGRLGPNVRAAIDAAIAETKPSEPPSQILEIDEEGKVHDKGIAETKPCDFTGFKTVEGDIEL